MSVLEKVRSSSSASNEGVDVAARVGLAARGLLYVVVGILAAHVALGDRGEKADRKGAIDAIARQPFGKLLLVVLIVGLVGYGLWRLSRAVRRDPDENIGKRIGHVATAGLYGFYAATCVGKLVGSSEGSGGDKEQSWTARALQWRFGPAIVAAVGLACWAFAGWRAYKAAAGDFEGHLTAGTPPAAKKTIVALARFGHAATTVAFGLIGWFLIQAGRQRDPGEAKGLDQSLKELASRSYGPSMLLAVSLGLIAFGLWCFAEAKYRSDSET
jgi:hypothetical protein